MKSLRLQWQDNNQKHKIEIRGTEHGPILIGRLNEYHITLNYPTVSRPHAEIFMKNQAWYIRNLSESNPVYIGNLQLRSQQRAQLDEGTSFSIGPIWFKATLKQGKIHLQCHRCQNTVEYKPEEFCPHCGMALHGARTVIA